MGAENLNPLDELKSLDRQVDLVKDLEGLKPIFYRLDEIARQYTADFEIQLTVGDIKQHLVNRGTRLKQEKTAGPAPGAEPTVVLNPPPVSQTPPPVAPPPIPQAPQFSEAPPPLPPPAVPPPTPAPRTIKIPPVPPGAPAAAPPMQEMLATGQQTPAFAPPPGPPQAQQPPPGPPPKAPLNVRRALILGALAGSVISIALLAFLVNQARKRNLSEHKEPVGIEVAIATTPPGASIRINGEVKCTSNCNLTLAPGNYQVTAFLEGYDPATSAVNVVPGEPTSVNLAMIAQATQLRILTDLDQGKVGLDDQPPVDLQEGQFVLEKVESGPHTIKLTSRTGDASFSFDIADAKAPAISGAVTTHNLIAVLVASMGTQARVVTNSGPMKLALNGQAQDDAGPAGVDLRNFQAGVDELVVGDAQNQRNMKETFGPGPMLTAFLKSDLNIGTLIVSTGEDDAHVFVNNKEYRRLTKRGQVRIPAIGNVSVRVAKPGFQDTPVETAEVKKGAEVRLEFKMTPLPQVSMLQIHGATPGAEVLIDSTSVGAVGADGNFAYNTVAPGDHTIDLQHDQFTPKRIQRSFKAGQAVVLQGADVVLAAMVTTGTVKLVRTPPDAVVTYRRGDESQTHELKANQLDLPAGSYIFFAKAPGYVDKIERLQVAAGETRTLEVSLAKEHVAVAAAKNGGIADFEEAGAWKKDGELWVHRGGGFVPYKLGPQGVYTFTVELLHGGNVFKGGRIRWAVQYADAKNYLLYELDKKTFWAEVVEKGKKLERAKTEHGVPNQKAYTVQIEITAEHVVTRIKNGNDWLVLDSFAEPGRNPASGKFGFLIQGNDEIGISDFTFQPK
ncbi:MAG TPA: PEGA domain-containing protein [Bryobacteraceae bacterium]|nr:PEGA domain-containing protein [Bryobacteraceae bacterium]